MKSSCSGSTPWVSLERADLGSQNVCTRSELDRREIWRWFGELGIWNWWMARGSAPRRRTGYSFGGRIWEVAVRGCEGKVLTDGREGCGWPWTAGSVLPRRLFRALMNQDLTAAYPGGRSSPILDGRILDPLPEVLNNDVGTD